MGVHRTPIVFLYKFNGAHCAPLQIHLSFYPPIQPHIARDIPLALTTLELCVLHHRTPLTRTRPRALLFLFFVYLPRALRDRLVVARYLCTPLYRPAHAPRHNAFAPWTRAPRAHVTASRPFVSVFRVLTPRPKG